MRRMWSGMRLLGNTTGGHRRFPAGKTGCLLSLGSKLKIQLLFNTLSSTLSIQLENTGPDEPFTEVYTATLT